MNLRCGPSGHGPDSRTTPAEHEPPTEAFTCSPAAALAFAAAPPAVMAIVVGADDAEQVRGNVALLSDPPPGAFWDELRERGLIQGDAPVPRSADR
jgi:aryl-alcohol dehydrogenase-like predicted oxidoreductase